MPTVRITPAIPGRVKVASRMVSIPRSINKFETKDKFAIKPNDLYLYVINKITRINPTINEIDPAFIESSPRSGPTVLSSTTDNGAGKAPDLKSNARSVASWKVKSPEITPLPPVIASLITGALIASLSRMIAILLPIFLVVA